MIARMSAWFDTPSQAQESGAGPGGSRATLRESLIDLGSTPSHEVHCFMTQLACLCRPPSTQRLSHLRGYEVQLTNFDAIVKDFVVTKASATRRLLESPACHLQVVIDLVGKARKVPKH
jgi:hypothetical protein